MMSNSSSNNNYSVDMLLKSAFVYEILNKLKYTNADNNGMIIKIYLENRIKEINSRYKDM